MALSWDEKLEELIKGRYNSKISAGLVLKYINSLPTNYKDEFSPKIALKDFHYLEKLTAINQLEIIFYSIPKQEHSLHLRLYLWQEPMFLSDILPIFDNFNLRIYSAQTYSLKSAADKSLWICDFAVSYGQTNQLKIKAIAKLFKEAFTIVYFGFAENDGFNKLILGAELEWREVLILRCYAKYFHQINTRYSQIFIEKTLVKNSDLAHCLVELFQEKHNPANKKREKSLVLESKILETLDTVQSLDEDRIIRHILNLIKATLRTNFYQKNEANKPKEYLAIKLDSKAILDMPFPQPLYEIFVYTSQFEGIHLRSSKVARGGIRWSERTEDFRTEILDLMHAQTIKNSIIIPSGAKGGFVIKSQPDTREALQAEIVRCYKLFISGLLDLTDNIQDQGLIHPKQVVCYDDYDPYLVVAADKGTAAFSDLANTISAQYQFWLGDAFASGGSTGYDHKKMGITARGAWESAKRHFLELNIDLSKSDITVVGIGDMSGDVFGNGMIYSDRIKLVAAFDNRHIFIDPAPEPKISYKERVRLFNLPLSSWEDYQAQIISPGGGVFKRSEKAIKLSPQIKDLLKIANNSLAPDDLIRAILKAPVQMLYNGGIGTYVKANAETNLEVGDRTNDWCRVNGDELQTQVVVEGGNLGFTQLGRIEFALKGGLINTDSIDNSAGVDCSDHEVNLKILLNSQIAIGKLTEKKRNKLLADATNEVAKLVLNDNYEQALLISYSAFRSKSNLSLHVEFIKNMISQGLIDPGIDFIPDNKKMLERKAAGIGLTRPELAVLIAYTKIGINKNILTTNLPEEPLLMQIEKTAFPKSICKKYCIGMDNHPLRRDIVATQLSNRIVNEMGITYVYRLQKEMGASIEEIIRAHTLASCIYKTEELQELILSLNFKIPLNTQYEMLYYIRYLVSIATRWFLNSNYLQENLEDVVKRFSPHIKTLEKLTPQLMGGLTKQYLEKLTEEFLALGIPTEKAYRIATYRTMYSALNIIEISLKNNFELVRTTKMYYVVGERFNLLWFRDQIGHDNREGHWNTLSRLTIRDELDLAQRELTIAILNLDPLEMDANRLVDEWINCNQRIFAHWETLLEQLHSTNNVDYPMIFIAMRELIRLTVGKDSVC
ncbi:MAG: NAD-glutamate dehydrogenase [Tatlockia sp.]|nr:NAD-glutamate dehydrogenase [Tatlockia sp.]